MQKKTTASRIFLVGLMGSGKTYWGKKLSAALNLRFADLDVLIEKTEAMTISEIFKTKGEAYFRLSEKKCLHELFALENILVATGGGTPCFFDNMQQMNTFGETCYLRADIETIIPRLLLRKNSRPLLNGKSAAELSFFLAEQLTQRESYYLRSTYVVETAGLQKEKLAGIFFK